MQITLESIFKELEQLRDEIADEIALKQKCISLSIIAISCSGLYGLSMGFYHSLPQAISSAVKVPLLFLATLVICLPTLHFIGLLFGSRIRFGQSLVVLLWGMAVTSSLLAAFAPVSFFFLLSGSKHAFLLLLHVAIFAFCGAASLSVIRKNMHHLSQVTTTRYLKKRIHLKNAAQEEFKQSIQYREEYEETVDWQEEKLQSKSPDIGEPQETSVPAKDASEKLHTQKQGAPRTLQNIPPTSRSSEETLDEEQLKRTLDEQKSISNTFLRMWMLLYMFVGSQMAYILSPYLGKSKEFAIINSGEGNFFSSVIHAFVQLIQGN
mgnify:CR=1 FL=1